MNTSPPPDGGDLPDWMKTKPPARKGLHRRTRSSMPEELHSIIKPKDDGKPAESEQKEVILISQHRPTLSTVHAANGSIM